MPRPQPCLQPPPQSGDEGVTMHLGGVPEEVLAYLDDELQKDRTEITLNLQLRHMALLEKMKAKLIPASVEPDRKALEIHVISATCSRNDERRSTSASYCTVEIQNQRGILAQTRVQDNIMDPEWNEDLYLHDYIVGQPLVFRVWGKRLDKQDALLGTATVLSDLFLPAGSGVLELSLNEKGQDIDAILRVHIFVRDVLAVGSKVRVRSNGRIGRIIIKDNTDSSFPYKVAFDDDFSDWFEVADLQQVQGTRQSSAVTSQERVHSVYSAFSPRTAANEERMVRVTSVESSVSKRSVIAVEAAEEDEDHEESQQSLEEQSKGISHPLKGPLLRHIPTKSFPLHRCWLMADAMIEHVLSAEVVQHSQSLTSEINTNNLGGNKSILGGNMALRGLALSSASFDRFMLPVDPYSPHRVAWDCTSVCLLLIEALVIPLHMLGAPISEMFQVFVWISNLWWTLDLVGSFFVDAYINGKLTNDIRQSALQYAKTWLIFDLAIVILGWLSMREGVLMRSVRFLRFARFLRVGKIHILLSRLQSRIISTKVALSARIAKNLFALLISNHFLACIWYALGQSTSPGWIKAQGLESSQFWRGYVVAFHWSITQFHGTMEISPSCEAERIYAVLVVCFALLSFSAFLSSVTEAMVSLQQQFQREIVRAETLHGYLTEHGVSKAIVDRVRRYLRAQQRFHRRVDSEVDYLQTMPTSLAMDILFETRAPFLSSHFLFAELCQDHPRTLRQICHSACCQVAMFPDENLFSYGDACTFMVFVESGTLLYKRGKGQVSCGSSASLSITAKNSQRTNTVTAYDWLCEAALWTAQWHNMGDAGTVTAVVTYTLERDKFADVVGLYEKSLAICCKYAKLFIKQLNAKPDLISDMLVPLFFDTGAPSRRSSMHSEVFQFLRNVARRASVKSNQSQQSAFSVKWASPR